MYIQYLLLLATNRAKAVRELTRHKSEKTSEVSEQDVGETTHRRNDRKHIQYHRNFCLRAKVAPTTHFWGPHISRKGQVKLDVKRAFFGLWLNPYRTTYALVFACGLKTREKFWILYCGTIWLLSGTIWLGTIWSKWSDTDQRVQKEFCVALNNYDVLNNLQKLLHIL